MAQIPTNASIFQRPVNTGEIAANAVTIIGQGTHINDALSHAIGASIATIVDSVDVSAGAKLAQDLRNKSAALTGSSSGPNGIKGVRAIVDGVAMLQNSAKQLAAGK